MKHNRNPLYKAVHCALGASVFAGLTMMAAPVIAQDDDETAELERVQVTGSRIKRIDIETTSPIVSIDRAQIESSGLQTIGDVLRDVSSTDSLGASLVTSDTNANPGNQTISMRNLGSNRTLVLVNGRRWLALGGGQVDITQLPVAIIERVEILGDGASAIYGTDAIAGVVNIILRDDYDGMEVDAFYGENFKGDGELRSYGVTLGGTGDRSSLFFNISKTEQEPIWAGDRRITETPDAFIPRPVFSSAFGEMGIFFVPDLGNVALSRDREIAGLAPGDRTPDDFQPIGAGTNYNFAPSNYLMMPSDRLTAFVKGHYDLADNIRAFGQFTFNQRKSQTLIAEVPLTSGFSGPQWEIPLSADSAFNPFGQELPAFGFRMTPLGPRTNDQDNDTYFTTLGLEGDFMLADRFFDWDVSYSRGESSRYSRGTNYVNLLRLREGVGPSFIDEEGVFGPVGGAVCGTPENPILASEHGAVSCVPVNFFNGVTGVTQDMAEFLRGDLSEQQKTGMHEWNFNISGEIVQLPAGSLAFAAGYERRTNTFRDIPDSLIAAGLSSSNFREETDGQQTAEEGYLELAVPILSGLPGVESLDFSIAARRSEFENTGQIGDLVVSEDFDNTSLQYGLMYRPVGDLLIRGSYSETFRAPSVSNLFAGGGEGFLAGQDPCGVSPAAGDSYNNLLNDAQRELCHQLGVPVGGAQQTTGQIRTLTGGNPFAQPEDGTTTVVGIVYSPRWLPGLDLSLDRWRVDLDDGLAVRGIQTIMNDCHLNMNLTSCNFITLRNEATGEIQTIRRGVENLARFRMRGYDFSANYTFDTAAAGRFSIALNGTYVDDARSLAGPGNIGDQDSVVGDSLGIFGEPVWRWRGNLGTNWHFGDFTVTYGIRHFGSLTEDCRQNILNLHATAPEELARDLSTFCTDPDRVNADGDPNPTHRIGSATYHDFSVAYETPWNGTVRAGLRNAFRKDPPLSFQTFANSFDDSYDIPGGQWWISYRQRF